LPFKCNLQRYTGGLAVGLLGGAGNGGDGGDDGDDDDDVLADYMPVAAIDGGGGGGGAGRGLSLAHNSPRF
jgi:hypothetical protein